MPTIDGTLVEGLDLHPRVAHDLTQRGLIWINEYRYDRYITEKAGSIDFVAINPRDGQVHIIECKLRVSALNSLRDQVERYHRAFGVTDALKEAYTFQARGDQINRLSSWEIDTHVISESTPLVRMGTPWNVWEDFQTVFHYWHGPYLLFRNDVIARNPHLLRAKDYQVWEYWGSLAHAYRGALALGDVSDYLVRHRDEGVKS